jgi:hypothetical protein
MSKKTKKDLENKNKNKDDNLNASEKVRLIISRRKKEKEETLFLLNNFPKKEKVLLSTGISPVLFLVPLILWIAIILVLIVFILTHNIFTIHTLEDGITELSQQICLAALGISTLILLPLSFMQVLYYIRCKILLTNLSLKIVDKNGEHLVIPIYDLEGFFIEKELLGDLFNYATIVIQNENLLRVELKSIAQPYILQKLVTKYLIKYQDVIKMNNNKNSVWDI